MESLATKGSSSWALWSHCDSTLLLRAISSFYLVTLCSMRSFNCCNCLRYCWLTMASSFDETFPIAEFTGTSDELPSIFIDLITLLTITLSFLGALVGIWGSTDACRTNFYSLAWSLSEFRPATWNRSDLLTLLGETQPLGCM